MDHLVPLNATVTLDNIYFHFLKKILPGTEDLVSLSKKSPNQLLGTGTRGINGDHQFLQTIHFFVFQRLDQRQISILLHSKIIKNIIKAILIQLDFFPGKSKFSEKFPIIISAFVQFFQFLFFTSRTCSDPMLLPLPSKGGICKNLFPPAPFLFPFPWIYTPQGMIIKGKKRFQLFNIKREFFLFQKLIKYLCRAISALYKFKNLSSFLQFF